MSDNATKPTSFTKKEEKQAEDIAEEVFARMSLKNRFDRIRGDAFRRFPLVFTLLSALGLVATFYGFERILDQVPIFADNPEILLGFGVFVLIATGTLYKQLNFLE